MSNFISWKTSFICQSWGEADQRWLLCLVYTFQDKVANVWERRRSLTWTTYRAIFVQGNNNSYFMFQPQETTSCVCFCAFILKSIYQQHQRNLNDSMQIHMKLYKYFVIVLNTYTICKCSEIFDCFCFCLIMIFDTNIYKKQFNYIKILTLGL